MKAAVYILRPEDQETTYTMISVTQRRAHIVTLRVWCLVSQDGLCIALQEQVVSANHGFALHHSSQKPAL